MIDTGTNTIASRSAWGFDNHEAPDAWKDDAVCAQVDPEIFYPEKGGSTREAKRVCSGCEVRDKCLQYALDNDERFGIWGGLADRERRRLKKGDLTVLKAAPAPAHCEVCDKPMYRLNSKSAARFCSNECRAQSRDRKHGTLARYKAGCTCPMCRAANAKWAADNRQANKRPPVTRDCRHCGAPFETDHGLARFCSVTCRSQAARLRNKTRTTRPKTSRERQCVHCGTGFRGHHKAKYCTPECRTAHRSTRIQPGPRSVECGQCGTEFTTTSGRARYCNPNCRAKAFNARRRNAA
jgi:WhiB family redox-sensing transcriptional regulator